MNKIRQLLAWVDNLPALPNLLATAGFHGVHTFLWGFVGLDAHALFGYAMKEAGGVLRRKEKWTGWQIADSVADVAFPAAAVLARLWLL